MPISIKAILSVVALSFAGQANADACDYTVSKLAGKTIAAVKTPGALTSAGMQAVGYYNLVHAGSGLTMLGSAAGTAGAVGGTSGLIGTVGAILMAPATLVIGGVAIIGVGSFEGYCYFQVKRITDPFEVREVIESIALHDEAVSIVQTDNGLAMALNINGETKTYLIRKLYIADGQLKHRDLLLNTNLGPVTFKSKEVTQASEIGN